MARLYLPPEDLAADSTVVITGDAHRYLCRVLRLSPGDAVLLFDGRGNEVEAVLGPSGSKSTTLLLGTRRKTLPAAGPRVTLIQALLRGERMDFLVQKSTELGVSRIWPALTRRTVAQGPGESRQPRWSTIAQEAARQCGRADVPEVAKPRPLAEILDSLAKARPKSPGLALLLWEAGPELPLHRAFGGHESERQLEVTLLVGPEGGFAPEEVALARVEGFRTVGLGPRILRSETAGIVAVALTQAALGGLG